MSEEQPQAPRILAEPAVRTRRRTMLSASHSHPLADFAARLRLQGRGSVPDFDPLDGGTEARALFLLEKPGPMTVDDGAKRAGSGFISRDNDDPTAEATFHFQRDAGLERADTLLWNVIPWWNGTRRITATELKDGIAELGALRCLLPRLEVVVLVGAKAAKSRKALQAWGMPVFDSAHPSPIVRASRRERWDAIPSEWAKARKALTDQVRSGSKEGKT